MAFHFASVSSLRYNFFASVWHWVPFRSNSWLCPRLVLHIVNRDIKMKMHLDKKDIRQQNETKHKETTQLHLNRVADIITMHLLTM